MMKEGRSDLYDRRGLSYRFRQFLRFPCERICPAVESTHPMFVCLTPDCAGRERVKT